MGRSERGSDASDELAWFVAGYRGQDLEIAYPDRNGVRPLPPTQFDDLPGELSQELALATLEFADPREVDHDRWEAFGHSDGVGNQAAKRNVVESGKLVEPLHGDLSLTSFVPGH